MYTDEIGDVRKYYTVVQRGTILNSLLLLLTVPSMFVAVMRDHVKPFIVPASLTATGVSIFMYFFLHFLLTGYDYLQYLPGVVCLLSYVMAVKAVMLRTWRPLLVALILAFLMLLTFAVITGMSWRKQLFYASLRSQMIPSLYAKKH